MGYRVNKIVPQSNLLLPIIYWQLQGNVISVAALA